MKYEIKIYVESAEADINGQVQAVCETIENLDGEVISATVNEWGL